MDADGLLLGVAALLLGSAAIGFALNRFVLRRITPSPTRAVAFAASRATFYAPSFVHLGHGFHLPAPPLLVLAESLHEFGPPLDPPTFLLPGIVFLGSLALAASKRFGLWFCGLLAAHLALFCALPLALLSWGATPFLWVATLAPPIAALSPWEITRAVLSVNAFPYFLLQHFLHLPVTEFGWLMLPSHIGWLLWCLGVWLALYGLLALALTRLTLRSSWTRTMRDA